MALVDVNADALHSATDQLAFGGRKAIAIRCNVADENEVAAMVQQTVSSFGGLDFAFNKCRVRIPSHSGPEKGSTDKRCHSCNQTGSAHG